MKVSIIVPVYNAEKYLDRCIKSILNQTLREFELILIDDGSKDNSGIICDTYAVKDNRITVVHKQNGGPGAARNAGLEIAKGEYITFIDSDDYVDENFLLSAYEAAIAKGYDLYICGLVIETYEHCKIIETNENTAKVEKEYTAKTLMEDINVNYPLLCISGPWCKLYRSQIIKDKEIRFDTALSLGEDSCFVMQFLHEAKNIIFSPEIFYHYYRGNSESLAAVFRKDILDITGTVYNKMRQIMLENHCNSAAMHRFEELYFDALINTIYQFFMNSDASTAQERLCQIKRIQNDPHINNIGIFDVRGSKRKLVLVLLKIKWSILTYLVFRIYYR